MAVDKPQSNIMEIWEAYSIEKTLEIRNDILMEYIYIVKFIASRLFSTYKNYVDLNDMISCGTIALIEAIDRFDYRRGIKFETFASFRVRGAMIDYMRRQDWVPRNLRRTVKTIEDAYATLTSINGRYPTDDEVALHLGMQKQDFDKAISSSCSFNVASFEELILESLSATDISGGDLPEHRIEESELKQVLAGAIDMLSEKERLVVTLYYFEELKAKEIAQVLEVSESRVSQIHSRALMKLKAGIRDYLMD